MKFRLFLEPRDLWFGVFWRRTRMVVREQRLPYPKLAHVGWHWQVYVCLLPCVVLLFDWKRFS